MTLQPTLHQATDLEFREMVDTLSGLLWELLKSSRRVADLARRRIEAQERGDWDEVEHCLEVGREATLDYILAERERVAALCEVGLTLGHRRPSTLRLAELILYVDSCQRDELLEIRELLRDVADDMDALAAAGCRLRRERNGRMSLFLADGVEAPELVDDPDDCGPLAVADAACLEIEADIADIVSYEGLQGLDGFESLEGLPDTFPADLAGLPDLPLDLALDAELDSASSASDPDLDIQIGPDGLSAGPSGRISPFADDL